MKGLFFVAGLFILLATGCKKEQKIVTKDYSGQFILLSPTEIPFTVRTEIHFNNVNFTGPGDSILLPYVGNGVFKLSGDSIYFTQTGSVPGMISQTNVLEGGFLLEKNADSLIFSRKDPEGISGAELRYQLQRD